LSETIRKIKRCSLQDLFLLVEAALLLGIMRGAILLPFKHVVKLLGLKEGEGEREDESTPAESTVRVGWAVRAAACRTPWQSRCLVQALACAVMLRRRKVSSTVYLGVARDGGRDLTAHAWLKSGGCILTGKEERQRFTVVASFSTSPADQTEKGL
jgi:hypothetical protein